MENSVTPAARPKSSREKVKAYRERLRKQGLRPVQIWVPDVRSADFAAEARRQATLVSQSAGEGDDQAFVDSISDFGDE